MELHCVEVEILSTSLKTFLGDFLILCYQFQAKPSSQKLWRILSLFPQFWSLLVKVNLDVNLDNQKYNHKNVSYFPIMSQKMSKLRFTLISEYRPNKALQQTNSQDIKNSSECVNWHLECKNILGFNSYSTKFRNNHSRTF